MAKLDWKYDTFGGRARFWKAGDRRGCNTRVHAEQSSGQVFWEVSYFQSDFSQRAAFYEKGYSKSVQGAKAAATSAMARCKAVEAQRPPSSGLSGIGSHIAGLFGGGLGDDFGSEIGAKINAAIQRMRADARDLREDADEIERLWGAGDYAALAERGIITRAEAAHMNDDRAYLYGR